VRGDGGRTRERERKKERRESEVNSRLEKLQRATRKKNESIITTNRASIDFEKRSDSLSLLSFLLVRLFFSRW